MANTLTLAKTSQQGSLSTSIRHRFSVSIDTYNTGGVDLSTLLDTALKPLGLDSSKVTDGFVNMANTAEGLKHVADFDPDTLLLTLKKQGGGSDLVEASNGAISAVAFDLTVFCD